MTRRSLALLIWMVSTLSEGALHWGVESWLDSEQLRRSVESDPLRPLAGEVSRPLEPEPEPEPTPAPTPVPTPAPPPPEGWDRVPAGSVDLFVLSQENRWELGKAKVVDAAGEDVTDMQEKLRALLRQLRMNYGDLIAVGTASCEGGLNLERIRARRRSEKLVDWLRPALADLEDPERRQIYRLNLGRFDDCDGLSPDETDEQRRVIVLAILNKNHGLNLDTLRDRLRQDLSTHRPLGFDPEDYSEFTLFLSR